VINEGSQLLKAPKDESPPQAIHAVRESFEGALDALGITLVVLIDDLDRCLPETTISTLEAIRLFLFLDRTAFVIAADNEMIRHAVKRHFDGVDDAHVTSYFDKLIQVPIGVPPLGTQEVRAYLILLFVEASELAAEVQDTVRDSVLKQLSKSWQGKRVDRAFMQTLDIEYPAPLIARFDAADRLAPLMTTAEGIKGNPRLIKRFLNALSIRMSLARAQGVDVDEAVLTKLLLFERCGEPKAYAALSEAIASSDDGAPSLLAEWEEHAAKGTDYELPEPWDAPFTRAWLALSPQLATRDLRGALYVSREHAPLVTPEDRLSSEAAEVLGALLEHPDMASDLAARVKALQHAERAVILDRLLERARQVTEWGVPPVLDACLVVTRPDAALAKRLSAFLSERPIAQLTPAIVQKISNEPWAKGVYAGWKGTDVSKPVKKAIERLESDGNVSVK
jgi:predicted KAP-like P-loop ATPase